MWKWCLVLVAACGHDVDTDAVCGDECGSDCVSAGFASGQCVDDACQCAVTPPDAANGSVTGTAQLFGHATHAGITVTLVGTSLSATTADDGSYTIADVPPGAYAVSLTAPKYLDATVPAIGVGAGVTVPPTMTLTHGSTIGPLSSEVPGAPLAFVTYAPDRQRVLLQTFSGLGFISQLITVAADASSAATIHTFSDGVGGFPNVSVGAITDDAVAFVDTGGAWSRPADGSTPPQLIVATPAAFDSRVQVSGLTDHSLVVEVFDGGGTFPSSVVVAKTDTGSLRTIWTQTSGTQAMGILGASETSVTYLQQDSTGTTASIHVIDLGTGTDTAIPLTGFTSLAVAKKSPDKQWVLLAGTQGATQRAIVHHIGTTDVTISPTGFAPGIDNPALIEAMADSSGFTFDDFAGGYSFFGTTTIPATNPIRLIPIGSAFTASIPTHLFGTAVIYEDSADASKLKLVTVPIPGALVPKTFTLDAKTDIAFFQVNGTELDGVWTIGGFNSPAQFKGMSVQLPVTAAPSVATLGAPLSTPCTLAVGRTRATCALTNAFFYLCPDTQTLSRFTPPFATVTATDLDTPVVSMQSLATGGIAYRRGDGSWWTAGTGAPVMLSTVAQSSTSFVAIGSWALFADDDLVSRASRLDGTAIDEPLIQCPLATTQAPSDDGPVDGEPLPELVGPNVLAPSAECQADLPTPYLVPQANLP